MNQLQVVNSAEFGILAGSGNILAGGDNLGVLNKVTIGSNLTLVSGVLSAVGGGSGSVTSVGITMPSAFSVSGSPITTSGTLAITGAGTTSQYIAGDGTLITFPSLTGYIPYTGATNSIDLNNQSVVNISHLGINTTTVPTILLRAIGDNNSGSRIAMRGYSSNANSSSIRVTKFRGTFASPQAPLSGDSLGKFELAGYGTTSSDGYPQASFEGIATENWGATARGSKTVIKITPNTTITQAIALTINQDKSAVFENSITSTSLIKTGGTSSQFLKADGSVDSSAYITRTDISASSPIVYNSTTGIISIPVATLTVSGYLNNGDWGAFNAKQNALGTDTTNKFLRADQTWQPVPYPTLLSQLTDVTITTPANGQLLRYTVGGWINFTPTYISLTALSATSPIFYNSTTGVISSQAATSLVNGYLTSTDWSTFNSKANALSGTINTIAYWDSTTTIASLSLATYPSLIELSYVKGVTSSIQTQIGTKQATITLTVTGSSGASTFVSNTLNIPTYTLVGLGGQPLATNLTSLSGLSYVSTSFVKMTAAGTFSLDTNTYESPLTFSSPLVRTTNTISIPVATLTVSGYLNNADWGSFNAKQNSLGTGTTGQFLRGDLTWQTVPYPTALSQLSDVTFTSLSNGQLLRYNAGGWSNYTPSYVTANLYTADGTLGSNRTISAGGYTLTINPKTTFSPSITAASLLAQGSIFTPTLTAAANNDVLVGVDITPTFTNGAFTGVSNFALRVTGSIKGSSSVTATSFVKTGAASTDFLKGDGTIDSNAYYLNSNPSSFIARTGISATSPVVYNSTTGVISIPVATLTVSGYLNNADWGSFNAKQNSLGTGTTSQYLRGDLTWVTPTFTTSLAALTDVTLTSLTNGQLLRYTVGGWVNFTPTYVAAGFFSATAPITYNSTTGVFAMAAATTSVNGYLSSTDWNTFNGKQNTLVAADATHDGYLTSANWVTFNAKQTAISLTTTGTSGAATFVTNTLNVPTYTLAGLGGQPQLNGTGFVKASGTTISYDNSTYLTTTSAASTYLPLAGGTLTGALSGTSGTFSSSVSTSTYLGVSRDGSDTIGSGPYIVLSQTTNSRQWIQQMSASLSLNFYHYNGSAWIQPLTLAATGAATFSSSVTTGAANSFNISSGPYNASFFNSSTSTSDYNAIKITQGAAGSATGYFGTGGSAAGNASFQNTFVIGTQSNHAFVLNTNDSERMRITSGGNVLLGFTTDSGYKLDVNGTVRIVGTTSIILTTTNTSAIAVTQYSITGANAQSLFDLAGAWNTTGNPTAIKLNITNTASGASSNLMDLQVGAVSKFKVDKAGLVTGASFYESSDKRQKTLIKDNFQAKGIETIIPKLYTKNDKIELGYYAQDVQGILDNAVSEDEKGMLILSYREVHTAKIYALELEVKELKELIKSMIDGNRN